MFCGYQVQAGHPAWQESRQGRTKRLAEEMESSLPECKALDHSAQAKRPYVPSRRYLARMNPDFASFEHPLALAGEDDALVAAIAAFEGCPLRHEGAATQAVVFRGAPTAPPTTSSVVSAAFTPMPSRPAWRA